MSLTFKVMLGNRVEVDSARSEVRLLTLVNEGKCLERGKEEGLLGLKRHIKCGVMKDGAISRSSDGLIREGKRCNVQSNNSSLWACMRSGSMDCCVL